MTIAPATSAKRSRPALTLLIGVSLALGAVLLTGCRVNEATTTAAQRLSPNLIQNVGSQSLDVPYGPDPAQVLNVWRPIGPAVGTIFYFHGGGWVGGDHNYVQPIFATEVNRGWDVVSVQYRLAPQYTLPTIIGDADWALRYVRASATTLNVNTSTLIAGGASAGGHLALMLAAAPGHFVDPQLPELLKAVDVHVDAVISDSGPTDLMTFWEAGGWAPGLTTSALGCTPPGMPSQISLPVCTLDSVLSVSPSFWALANAWFHGHLPPAYFAYGGLDGLVVSATQADPITSWWEIAAGYTTAWYDLVPSGGHGPDYQMNKALFDLWLDKVLARRF